MWGRSPQRFGDTSRTAKITVRIRYEHIIKHFHIRRHNFFKTFILLIS